MTMPSPFPGMDPYLENSALWPNVHGRLIVAIADALSPLLLPKYQPIIEEAVYRTDNSQAGRNTVMIGVPDVTVQNALPTPKALPTPDVATPSVGVAVAEPVASPIVVELPMASIVRQKFVEIRNASSQEVVTVIEVLSPTNKKGDGRVRYLRKRSRTLESQANLVEVDLLHKGDAMPMLGQQVESHYRVLASAVQQRPQALLYPFNLPMPLPPVPIPLRAEDTEPVVDFQLLLSQIYDRSGYAFSLDYAQPPQPSWNQTELSWISRIASQRATGN